MEGTAAETTKKKIEKVKTSEHIVAYLDMLGTTRKMKKEGKEHDSALNGLNQLYRDALGVCSKDGARPDVQVKIFSDNIVFAQGLEKYDDQTQRMEAIRKFMVFIYVFQSHALDSRSWLLRGGVSIGPLFMDESMVWGKALLEAYYLESKVAVYPRTVIEPSIVEEISAVEAAMKGKYKYRLMTQDFDGLYFADYLQHNIGKEDVRNRYSASFEAIKREARLQPGHEGNFDRKIYQKLRWLVNYYNRTLKEKGISGRKWEI